MLNAEQILAEAEQAVGVSDNEPAVRANLERLCADINTQAELTEEGWRRTHLMLVNDACNRLEGVKWLRQHPEIGDEPIEQPLFLTGLPRSGTTYFQYLFDCDPRFRLLRTWEALTPSPPPGADPAAAEQRRAAWAVRRRQLAPEVKNFAAMHLHDEDGSEECHIFLQQSAGAAGFNNLFRTPGYFDYLLDEADLAASYRIHKRQLQLLQWQRERKPWALKYPNHLLAVPEIMLVYPDARFVMTHRDPLQTVASIAKLSYHLRLARGLQAVDKIVLGREMTHFIKRHVERLLAAVDGPYGARISHVDYYALVADPVTEMIKVHRQLELDTPPELQQAVANWHRDNPKNARGANHYTLAEFGLDEPALEELFADYMARFNIPREADGLARKQ
ncbi:sulfotransferase family protein [Halioxenophilus sp. WMMB6]|uniref:sulfotransferase family protein n=1 Tax=Halioxenophilus sp. WMMB6 TaxID=3073815 RepID=UPI00295F4C40|nr:sulfotransferase [Halioxenophilus sp. WMMB6]